jgi:two-component system LytT family response regulator
VKDRLRNRRAATPSGELLGLLESLATRGRHVRRLAVRSAGKTVFVDVDDIDYLQAAENYVQLHVGRHSHLLHATLASVEKSLDPARFVRVHRSIIVQAARIQSLEPAQHGEYVIMLHGGVRLRSGRTYGDKLRALADNPF